MIIQEYHAVGIYELLHLIMWLHACDMPWLTSESIGVPLPRLHLSRYNVDLTMIYSMHRRALLEAPKRARPR